MIFAYKHQFPCRDFFYQSTEVSQVVSALPGGNVQARLVQQLSKPERMGQSQSARALRRKPRYMHEHLLHT